VIASQRHMSLSLCLSALFISGVAFADITDTDVQVAGRVLGFLQRPLRGTITVGIVYSPDSSQSLEEAKGLQRLLGDAARIGGVTLKPVLVSSRSVALSDAEIFFLVPGIGADADALARTTTAKHLPCITTDIPQVQAGRCAIGVRSRPRIEILENRAAAAAAGTSFSTVFRMFITEL
jgi:hypothetical protein